MNGRVVFDVRREGRRVVLRRHRAAVWRLTWLGLAVPTGAGAAAGVWDLLGVTAWQVTRVVDAVLVFGLVVAMIRMTCGGRR